MPNIESKPDHARCAAPLENQAKKTCGDCLPMRIFAGIYPAGISYADKTREKGGDYARLAFFTFRTLELDFERDCPRELQAKIVAHAEAVKARRGEQHKVSTSGQTVTLGHGLE